MQGPLVFPVCRERDECKRPLPAEVRADQRAVLPVYRAKTANITKECPQEITFFCDDLILSVIAEWGNADRSPDNYIFPFLEPDMDGYAIRHKVQLVTHLINEHMKGIAEELGLDFVPKSNDARHAFATQLKRGGKSTEFIRELIGHERASTTQDYLDDFEDDTKRGIAEQLLPFRKSKHHIVSNRISDYFEENLIYMDAPFLGLRQDWNRVEYSISFETWFQYCDNSDSRICPLLSFHWQLKATAEKDADQWVIRESYNTSTNEIMNSMVTYTPDQEPLDVGNLPSIGAEVRRILNSREVI